MYNIYGFTFSSASEVSDFHGACNLCHEELNILDRMIRKGQTIDDVYGELSKACVAYYLGDDASRDAEDELLGIAYEEWKAYAVNNLPDSVLCELLDAETEAERRDALEDYEA